MSHTVYYATGDVRVEVENVSFERNICTLHRFSIIKYILYFNMTIKSKIIL